MMGTAFGMVLFFAAYFWILRHPAFPPVIMPLTAIDRWIGFFPAALIFYLSLWFYVSLAPALLTDLGQLQRYLTGTVVLAAIGLGIFFLWPTTTAPSPVDWSSYPAFAFMKKVDASGNACPSLHAGFAVYSAMWFGSILRESHGAALLRWGNWIWCAGILYSTLATRQHVFVDILAGSGLGWMVGALSIPRRKI
jgi:membrane-associated phospholipid phosphatase